MSKRKVISKLSILLCFVMIIGISFALAQPQVAYAAGTTYYINNLTGSNSNPGTSQASPWYDFTNVNSRTFQPGDQILLARGCTWNQRMDLYGSGTSADWITVDAYGTGNKPKIQRNSLASDRTVWMHDPSYWIVKNLEICNAGMGIYVHYTTKNHQGLYFDNLYIHDISGIWRSSPDQSDFYNEWNSQSIWISGAPPTPGPSEWVIKDLRLTNSEICYTDAFWFGMNGIYSTYPVNTLQDVLIKNNYFHNIPGDGDLEATTNAIIMDNRIENIATQYQAQGTTGIFLWNVNNVAFTNNLVKGIPNTGSTDLSAFDMERYCEGVKFRGNYIGDIAGSALEYLMINGTADWNTNNLADSNTLINTSTAGSGTFRGSLMQLGNTSVSFTGTASDNLYYDPYGFNTGTFTNWTFTNNLSVSPSNIYNAGNGFSGTQGQNQWSYQYYNGTGWSNISSYDSANERWGSSYYASRFNLLPDSNSSTWVARAWTAPGNGTIRIRGRVLKNDVNGGDGVNVRITKNGSVIWPTGGGSQTVSYNDNSGYNTNLNSISVAANDVIRFEVNNGGAGNASNDLVSWSPTVEHTVTASGAKIDDTDAGITYSGTWYSGTPNPAYYNSTIKWSTTAGSYAQYTFTGTGISWYASKKPDQGKADVYIDGVLDSTIDLYSPTESHNTAVYTKTGLSAASHTVKVVVRNDKNPSSSNYYVTVDAFEYTN